MDPPPATKSSTRTIPPPGPADEDLVRMDARVRTKLELGEPLDEDERAFLASQPADREVRY